MCARVSARLLTDITLRRVRQKSIAARQRRLLLLLLLLQLLHCSSSISSNSNYRFRLVSNGDNAVHHLAVGGGSVAEWLALCRVTVLGKLFTPIVPLHQAAKGVAALLRVAAVTAGLAESNGSLPPGL